MQNQLNSTLIDVRKAYRLLFDFQDRIRNLVSFIGGHLDFNFSEGNPVFSSNAKNGKNVNLDQWAWDWLSMYFYQFKFEQKDGLTFAVFILADTGFYDFSKHEGITASKLKPETFNTVEKAQTKLFLVLGKKMWKQETKLGDWESIFFQENRVFSNGAGGTFLFKEYTLEHFINESSAISSLEDFQAFCNQNDISIQLKRRELQ
ncbi:hypothetical protein [Chryseobacterium sp.]|uniref:hypothetical protein n=1 Tax=Chryseobacterium sp. TaxID=1871047 RepID=UPI002FC87225